MSCFGVEHKLRVFISSKCGEKYTVARKSLQKLLDETGLVETYVFETDPASSEDTQSAYLEYVDGSNLCIFLVDNEDGVSPAVLSEEKRAKDKHLRLLYIFCDERKKEPTPMQEEIRTTLSQKYHVVHEFSDLVPKAYDSVMQDIIAVYKKKDEQFTAKKIKIDPLNSESLDIETSSLVPISFSEYSHVASVLTRSISPSDPFKKDDKESSLEELLSEHLLTVTFQKPFDESIIDGICIEVLKDNSGEMSEVLQLRYQAQKLYYLAKYDECIDLLQHTFSVAIEKQGVPIWIANDIAIDIRYIQGCLDEENSKFTIENPGQKLIDTSGEPVYFPYLDRLVENMQEEIAKKYYSQLNISPYTVSYGGVDQLFTPLVNAFCVAEIHGSIVQTEMTRDRIISIYSMLCTLYEDHDLFVEYIKYLITNQETKKLDTVIRTYNQSIDIINGQDVDAIMDCINNMFNPVRKMMSKYLLASRLSNYMNDVSYAALYESLVEYAFAWVCDDKRIFNIYAYIFDFFRYNSHRIKGNDLTTFLCEVFNHRLKRFYMDCFKIIRSIDFNKIDREDQIRLKHILIDVTSTDNEQLFDQYYSSAIIHFCKNTVDSYEDLEAIIKKKNPDFYKHTFMLEMSVQRDEDFSEYISSHLKEASSRNKTQGVNGAYSGYAYESLGVVYNIIKSSKMNLNKEQLNSIVDVAIETLAAEKQTISSKLSAVIVLQLLYFLYTDRKEIWDNVSNLMKENISIYSVGNEMSFLSKDTNIILSFQYNLFICVFFETRRDVLLEMLYSMDTADTYTIIQFLCIIINFLDDAKSRIEDEKLLNAFLYYSILLSKHRERDIKYQSTKCLIELTYYMCTKHLALLHLSKIMNTGSQAEKIAVLTGVGQIQTENDEYLKQIINKGRSDNNYTVRYVAKRDYYEY